MIYLPIIQTVCFSLYVWYIVYHFGVIQSISQSWYEEEPSHMKWLFIAFVLSLSIPTALLGYFTKNIWFYFSAVGLAIIAAAPAFRDKHKIVGVLHTGGTVAGIAFGCYALITHGIYFPAIGCAIVSILLDRLKISNATFWTEIGDYYFIALGIYQMITLHL